VAGADQATMSPETQRVRAISEMAAMARLYGYDE